MSRQVSQAGVDLIKTFEGLSLKAYKAVKTERYYTIGYGHYGADVKEGQVISQKEAENMLKSDLQKFVKNVNNYMPKYNFNQNQFDALVSFAYNVGSINQLTASGTRTIEQISSAFTFYNKSGGKVLTGLVKRRAKEKALFDSIVSGKTNEQIAQEVIDGMWGNGNTRKSNLIKAGYDYKVIQKLVNSMLKGN